MSEFPQTQVLKNEFLDEEYAHAYADEFLNIYLATQIRVLREQRGWTQEELATKAGMKQERISKLEDVDYDAWTIGTLRRLARAFDVALEVSFQSFTKRIMEMKYFSRKMLSRQSRMDDLLSSTMSTYQAKNVFVAQNLPLTIYTGTVMEITENYAAMHNNYGNMRFISAGVQ